MLAIALVASSTGRASAAPINIVQDPGFENAGPTSYHFAPTYLPDGVWQQTVGEGQSVGFNANAHSGSGSYAPNSFGNGDGTIAQLLMTQPGQTYYLTFFYSYFASGLLQVSFGGTQVAFTSTMADGVYRVGTAIGLTPTGSNTRLDFHSFDGTLLIDDVSVTASAATPVAEPLGLLVAASDGSACSRYAVVKPDRPRAATKPFVSLTPLPYQPCMSLIYLLAGEASGDVLGARLIAALRRQRPGLTFAGIGGTRMIDQGLTSLHPMADLAVMGLVEILPRLPLIRRRLAQTMADIAARRPDVLVTIDSPGYTKQILKRVAKLGIRRAHYVAPQVWAWHEHRVRQFSGLWDRLLCLLPFEPAWFAARGVEATFVGHPVLESGADTGNAARFRQRRTERSG